MTWQLVTPGCSVPSQSSLYNVDGKWRVLRGERERESHLVPKALKIPSSSNMPLKHKGIRNVFLLSSGRERMRGWAEESRWIEEADWITQLINFDFTFSSWGSKEKVGEFLWSASAQPSPLCRRFINYATLPQSTPARPDASSSPGW